MPRGRNGLDVEENANVARVPVGDAPCGTRHGGGLDSWPLSGALLPALGNGSEQRVIPADSHVQEPPEPHEERPDRKYRDRVPRFEDRDGAACLVVARQF